MTDTNSILGTVYLTDVVAFFKLRFTLQRGLQNLEQKHHVDLSSKFAQMEFKLGDAERGKTIFENIVGNYPRRTDQWSVYVDMVTLLPCFN